MCEEIGRFGMYGQEVCGHYTKCDTRWHCCCESMNSLTANEKNEMLEIYKKNLERELEDIKEKISKLKKEDKFI